jgi:hypothetical protein
MDRDRSWRSFASITITSVDTIVGLTLYSAAVLWDVSVSESIVEGHAKNLGTPFTLGRNLSNPCRVKVKANPPKMRCDKFVQTNCEASRPDQHVSNRNPPGELWRVRKNDLR